MDPSLSDIFARAAGPCLIPEDFTRRRIPVFLGVPTTHINSYTAQSTLRASHAITARGSDSPVHTRVNRGSSKNADGREPGEP